jgi:hypothetical protein
MAILEAWEENNENWDCPSQAMAIHDLHRRFELRHGNLSATSFPCHSITDSVHILIRGQAIYTVGTSFSAEYLIVCWRDWINMRELQEHAVHHDLEVAHDLGSLDSHVVNPYRPGQKASTGGGEQQWLTSLERASAKSSPQEASQGRRA